MPRDGSNIYHRPPGTDGTPNYTVESARYNAFTADVEQDLNLPRPIIAGGTGANNGATALNNLGGELSQQLIGNYNADPFQAGSFYSAAGATGAPSVNAFTGICYAAVVTGSATTDLFIEARDQVTGNLFVRQKKANVWQPWSQAAGVTTGSTPPTGVTPNTLWWDQTRGKLFIYYQDVDSSQWVEAVAVPDLDPNAFVQIVGDTMIGPLILAGDPTAPLGTATKQYVDAGDAASVASAGRAVGARGQCKLVKSGANLVLLPFGGNLLTVNGVNCTVPDAGISLAPTGLTPSTLYYIYAVATAGTVSSLEASTTTHAISTTVGNKGVEIKSGDDTRSLVGMVYVAGGPAFADTSSARWVRSWHNRSTAAIQGPLDTASTTTSGSFVAANTAAVSAINFAGEVFDGVAVGIIANTLANTTSGIAVFIDGAQAGVLMEVNVPGANYRCAVTASYVGAMAEGLHTYTYGCRALGGGTFSAGYGMTMIGKIMQ
jgi:hypothetical protein